MDRTPTLSSIENYDYSGLDEVGVRGSIAPYFEDPVVDVLSILFPSLRTFRDGFENVDGWVNQSVKFFDDYYFPLLISVALYCPIVFGIQAAMKDSKPFDLRRPLIAWNLFLAAFSIAGAINTLPLIPISIVKGGWWGTICTRWCFGSVNAQFYAFLFDLSKALEFVDTLFIVLRKKPLIFLHWYHHVVTMLFCWYCNQTSQRYGCHGFYFAAVNLFVHAIMYSYYAVMAMRIKIPTAIAKSITIVQIAQMVFGIAIVLTHGTCDNVDETAFVLGCLLYLSFFALFAKFFLGRYITKKKPEEKKN